MSIKVKVALINYDMGNLRSVAKALEKVGCSVQWVDQPGSLKHCQAVVLPGVGAFQTAVHNLKQRKLFDPIRTWIQNGKPFLGICLGYQLLFEKSEESKNDRMRGVRVPGLEIFKGIVKRLPRKKGIRIPHIGWNQIQYVQSPKSKVKSQNSLDVGRWTSDIGRTLFKNVPNGSYFYFVHSYVPEPEQKEIISTTTKYGVEFASSIQQGRLLACQFHPEKSGENGLKLLKNFKFQISN